MSREINQSIEQYLKAVDANLRSMSEAERRQILDDLRAHIAEALHARSPNPTSEDMKAVLKELAPPESYCPSNEPATARAAVHCSPASASAAGEPVGHWAMAMAVVCLLCLASAVALAVAGWSELFAAAVVATFLLAVPTTILGFRARRTGLGVTALTIGGSLICLAVVAVGVRAFMAIQPYSGRRTEAVQLDVAIVQRSGTQHQEPNALPGRVSIPSEVAAGSDEAMHKSATPPDSPAGTPWRLSGSLDVAAIRKMRQESPDLVTASDAAGRTLLHIAARAADIAVVRELLNSGAKVNTADKAGFTALHIAAEMKHLELATTLLDLGTDANAVTTQGQTPLHLAVVSGSTDMVKLLLDCRAQPAIQDNWGATPVDLAMTYARSNILKMLNDSGAPVTIFEKVYLGDIEAVRQSLDDEPDLSRSVNWQKQTLLHIASARDNLAMVRLLLERGSDINARDRTNYIPLHWVNGHVEIAKVLLAAGADVEARDRLGRTPLRVLFSKPGMLELLLAHGANINSQDDVGETALFDAAGMNNASLVSELLRHGADVGVRNNQGMTAKEKYAQRFATFGLP